MAQPGTRAGALDAAVRAVLAEAGLDCPHHIGHGVGADPQESPRLVPGDETMLEEGMVVAIEPGAYTDGFGLRLEHLVAIEAGGPRVLTAHSLDLI
jgi:Xaa-Pro aminopeptidase